MTLTNLPETINNTLQQHLNNSASTSSPKTSILLWTNASLPNSFILKKDGKKYLGLLRKDQKGQDYWKFKELREKSSQKANVNNSEKPAANQQSN